MANTEIVLQPLGLSPFSSAGRTKEHDAHGELLDFGLRISNFGQSDSNPHSAIPNPKLPRLTFPKVRCSSASPDDYRSSAPDRRPRLQRSTSSCHRRSLQLRN